MIVRGMNMKALIVYMSVHHQNTFKIAQAMARTLDAQMVTASDANAKEVEDADIIGFGSGIYMFKHHALLLKFVDSLPVMKGKKAFIFSTHGAPKVSGYHNELKKKLVGKGFDIIGEFDCMGWDTFGPLALIGGTSKGKPDESDMAAAVKFAEGLKTEKP